MNNSYHYRLGTSADLAQLRELGLIAYGQFQGVLGEDNWRIMSSNLGNEDTYLMLLKTAQCFVCETNNEIIGMAFLIPHGNPFSFFLSEWSYIRLVGVHPEHEGNGIGKKLTQQCIDAARNSGEKIIALHTSEFQNAARHIYESLDFKKYKELGLIYDKQFFLYTLELN